MIASLDSILEWKYTAILLSISAIIHIVFACRHYLRKAYKKGFSEGIIIGAEGGRRHDDDEPNYDTDVLE